MHLPTLLAILVLSASAQTDPDAIEVAHNFFKLFTKAIKSGDVFKVLALISPQPGDTNIDASKMIQELKGLIVSFRGAHFVDFNINEIEVNLIFRRLGSEKAIKSAIFVIEAKPASDVWTIKSMTDIVDESRAVNGMLPPILMG